MNKIKIWMLAAIITLCGTGVLASCDIDNNDTQTDEYRRQLAGTRWHLSEVMDTDNEWKDKNLTPDFDIPYLSLGDNGQYEIRIYNYRGSNGITTLRGSYKVEGGRVYLYDDTAGGTLVEIVIRYMNDNMLEASVNIYGEDKVSYNTEGSGVTITQDVTHYTVRFTRDI